MHALHPPSFFIVSPELLVAAVCCLLLLPGCLAGCLLLLLLLLAAAAAPRGGGYASIHAHMHTQLKSASPYDVLGVAFDADLSEIIKAYESKIHYIFRNESYVQNLRSCCVELDILSEQTN